MEVYRFRPDIQGLRAISVAAVILFHMGVPGFEGGFLGVDVFFAISGFLMASIICRDLDCDTFSYREFYMRRVRRIFPAVFLTLLLTFVASWFVLFPKNFEDFTDVMGASVLFLGNAVLMNQSSGYFAETLENHPLLHMWSLAVEEQFYIIFPLIFVASLRLGVGFAFFISLLLFFGSLVLSEIYYDVSPSATFFHLPARIFEFFVGVIAFLILRYSKIPTLVSDYGPGLGLTLICGSFVWFDREIAFPSAWSLAPLLGTALVLVGDQRRNLSAAMISNQLLVFLGGISFSLYLLHQPILALMRYQEIQGLALLSAAMAGMVPIAWAMKVYVEDYARFSLSWGLLVAMLVSAGLLLVGLAVANKHYRGMPERFEGELMRAVSTAVGSPFREKCHTDGENYLRPRDACQYFKGDLNWAVLGDSHGVPIAYALADYLKERDQSLVHLTFSGCGFSKPAQSACRRWLSEAEQYLIEARSITDVVFSFRLLAQLYGRHEFIYPEIPRDKSDAEIEGILFEYAGLIERLQRAGKRVIWVMQPPEVGETMVDTLRSVTETHTSVVSVPYSWWLERSGLAPSMIKKMVSGDTILIWPEEALCTPANDACFAIKDGVSFYRDRDHLSIEGAKRILKPLFLPEAYKH